MILLAAMAMTTLAVQADEAQQQAVEMTTTSMDAATATDTATPTAEDDTNATEEVTPKS